MSVFLLESRRPPGGFRIADYNVVGARFIAPTVGNIFGVTSLKLLESHRLTGGFRIVDCGFRIDNGAASLSVENHLWGNFFEVIGKLYG